MSAWKCRPTSPWTRKETLVGSAPAVARRRPPQHFHQSPRHRAVAARDPAIAGRGDQRQRHAVVRASGLSGGDRSLSANALEEARRRRRADRPHRQRRELLRQPHRYRRRQADCGKNRAQSRTRRTRRAGRGLAAKVAVANAKARLPAGGKRLFPGTALGAPRQGRRRAAAALWASTAPKIPPTATSIYVEELIGPDTVNTMPMPTLDAFRDHGKVRDSLNEDVAGADAVLAALDRAGISLDAITSELAADAVTLFADAFESSMARWPPSGGARWATEENSQTIFAAAAAHRRRSIKRARTGARGGNIRRLWSKDATLWTGGSEASMAGLARRRRGRRSATSHLAGFRPRGPGGEFHRHFAPRHGRLEPRAGSIGGEVFGSAPGFPKLHILELHRSGPCGGVRAPHRSGAHAVYRVEQIRHHARAERADGLFLRPAPPPPSARREAAKHFIAITDPGSRLRRRARARVFAASSSAFPYRRRVIRCCPFSAWCRSRRAVTTCTDSSKQRA